MADKTIIHLILAALGIGLVAISAGAAHAQYPPRSSASVVLAATSPALAAGEATSIAAVVQDGTGSRIAGVWCAFTIVSQPGSDANLESASRATDEQGVATTTLTSSTAGNVVVNALCAGIAGQTTVIVSAPASPAQRAADSAALPGSGAGVGTNGAVALIWPALCLLLAGTGLGVLQVGRRTGR